jgi:cardiolipin synthase A/B
VNDRALTSSTRRTRQREREVRPALASVMQGDHGLALLTGGVEFFPALVAAIDGAEREVMLETYIFDMAHSVLAVAEALERAALRGVAVRVVVDGVGTGDIPAEWQQRWAAAGVRWRVFNPAGGWRMLLPPGWRRLHRKLVVVDQKLAFCGGINLLDDYHDPNHGSLVEPRLDFTVRATGPLVADVHDTMTRLWLRLQVARKARQLDVEATVKAVRTAAEAGLDAAPGEARPTQEPGRSLADTDGAPMPPEELTEPSTALVESDAPALDRRVRRSHDSHSLAALVLRDNVRFRRRIETAYRLAINQARREIIIANAYFIPGVTLQRALLRAAERGVKVTVLLQGRYEYFMAYHASRAVYDTLLKAGIRVVEYDASFLHAKVAVMDGPLGDVATVGSSNLDPLSLLLAREANVFVRDDAFANDLRQQLLRAIELQGRPVEPRTHEHRPWRSRVLNWIAYAMMRFAILVNGKKY